MVLKAYLGPSVNSPNSPPIHRSFKWKTVSSSKLYFVCCCALRRTGKFALQRKVVFILTDYKKLCFDVSLLTTSTHLSTISDN